MKHPFFVSALALAVSAVSVPALAQVSEQPESTAVSTGAQPEREFFPHLRKYLREQAAARTASASVVAASEHIEQPPSASVVEHALEPLTTEQMEAMKLQAVEAARLQKESDLSAEAQRETAARAAAVEAAKMAEQAQAEEEVLMEMDVDMKTGRVVVTDHSAKAVAESKPKSFWSSLFGAKEAKSEAVPVIAAFTMAVNEESTDSPKVTLHPVAEKAPADQPAQAVAPVVAATPVAPVVAKPANAPAIAPTRTQWMLKAGQPIHAQLQAWALDAGWKLNWKMASSWIVPADVGFSGEFDDALERVVTALYGEGHAVRLMLWEGNKYAEVLNVDGK